MELFKSLWKKSAIQILTYAGAPHQMTFRSVLKEGNSIQFHQHGKSKRA